MSPRWSIPSVLTLAAAALSCEAVPILEAGPIEPQFITNGATDDDSEYANVGAFIVRDPANGEIFPICTGTLISPTVFLTAAHCTAFYLRDLEPAGYEVFVSFGSPIGFGPLTSPTTTLVEVTAVHTNPRYNQTQVDPGDLGVLLLSPQGTAGIVPAALPAAGLLDQLAARGGLKDAVFTAVGYGLQDRVVGGGLPYFMDMNPIPRMYAFSSFKALGPGYVRLSQNASTGDGGTCFGDSGGPNFLPVGGALVLAATTVRGDAVCRSTNVDQRLDTPSARAFLGLFVTLP